MSLQMRMMRTKCVSLNAKTIRRELWEQVASDRQVERAERCVSKKPKSSYEVGPFLLPRRLEDEDECILRYIYDNDGDMK